ncbi:hypothetical protein [Paenibacillus gorillae]|uniref:hypothetical protein n=1 Tax=Paenibacillus gorillae TaxID=1243662 RepID=UPI0004B34251|nr:hypothetical protein [Paenibacillus gorillae]
MSIPSEAGRLNIQQTSPAAASISNSSSQVLDTGSERSVIKLRVDEWLHNEQPIGDRLLSIYNNRSKEEEEPVQ